MLTNTERVAITLRTATLMREMAEMVGCKSWLHARLVLKSVELELRDLREQVLKHDKGQKEG